MKRWLALFALVSACGNREHTRHSVLLVTLDTTRADALSCYGNAEPTTPVLDALAADGVRFDSAHTVMALTQPAHTSMLTGLYPPRHGLRDNGVSVLPATAETLAERAREAGFPTAAFVSSVVLDDDFGLAQGFEVYSVPKRRGEVERAHGAERPAKATIDAALEWLAQRDPAEPFFLWVHLYDPHHPYSPSAAYAARFSTPYLAEVAEMDHELGRLFDGLKARGMWDETFVLALADHGEAFGEHGEVTHGTFCYETTLHVPFVARWPQSASTRRAGQSSHELASAVDVAPTLVEAMGLEELTDIDGLSFFARALPSERGVYFESYYAYFSCGWSPLSGWLDARGKYIHSSEPELYDWRADPRELHDLAATRAAELDAFRAPIAHLADAPALAHEEIGGNGEALDAIRGLGYTGAGEDAGELPHPLAKTALASPRSQAGFFVQQARAQELDAAGKTAEAAAVYEAVLRETPTNFFALDELGAYYLKLGRAAEAVTVLEQLTQSGPPRGRYYHKLGLALLAAKRPADAVAPLTRAVELTAGRPRYLDALREVLTSLGRASEMDALEARYRKARSDG